MNTSNDASDAICGGCGDEPDEDPYFDGMCEGCYRYEHMCEDCGGVGYTVDHSNCLGWVAACDTIKCETCGGTMHPDAQGRFMVWESESPHAAPVGLAR